MARRGNLGGAIAAAVGAYVVLKALSTLKQPVRKRQSLLIDLYSGAARALKFASPPPLKVTTKVENAASNGTHVLINPQWANGVMKRHCADGRCRRSVLYGVLAHELAHHLHQDALFDGEPHQQELRADALAGYAMGVNGIDATHLACVYEELSAIESDTHPHADDRIDIMRQGHAAGVRQARKNRQA